MKRTMPENRCLRVQKDILFGDTLPGKRKQAMREHLLNCPECWAFVSLQAEVRQSLANGQDPWQPRQTILQHLQQHLSEKYKARKKSPAPWLEGILGYRIPVYQVLFLAAMAGCLYWGSIHFHALPAAKPPQSFKYGVDETVIESAQAEQVMQAMRGQKIGRSISEDSLYQRFSFTM